MFTRCARLTLRGRLPRPGLAREPIPTLVLHAHTRRVTNQGQCVVPRARFLSTQSTPPKEQRGHDQGPSTIDTDSPPHGPEPTGPRPHRAEKATRQIHHLPTRTQALQAEQEAKEAEEAAQAVSSSSSSSWWGRIGILKYILGAGVGIATFATTLNLYKHWQMGEFADVEFNPVRVGTASLLRKTAPVPFTDTMGFAVVDIPVTRRMITKCGDGSQVDDGQVTEVLTRAVLSSPWLHIISDTIESMTHLSAFSLYWSTRESIRAQVEAKKAPDQRYTVITATDVARVADHANYQQCIADLPMLPGNGASSFMIINRNDNEIVLRHIPGKDTHSPVQSLYIAVSFKAIDGLDTQAIIALGWNVEDGVFAGIFRPILVLMIAPVIVESMRQLRATFESDF